MNGSAKSSPVVSVVIPNWNGLEFLKVVLPSLRKQTLKGFEVIVVDNGSEDDSVAYVRKQHSAVRVVALDRNIGFAGGVNEGMRAATGEFVALMNNDLELKPDCLAELVAAMRRYPKAGSAVCKMMQYHDRRRIDETGGMASWYGTFRPRGRGELDRGQYDRPDSVFYACGGAGIYRSSVLKEIGLFDENFFAYLEDVDWGFRSQLAGWSCEYVPTAVVYHMGGATTKRLSGFAQRLWTRNTCFVILKNYPFPALVRYAPKLCFAQAKTFVGAIKDGWLGTYFSAQLGFWRGLPRVLGQRRRIQRRRKADMRYLNGIISKRFELGSKLLRKKARTV